jgi:hypothetical protein
MFEITLHDMDKNGKFARCQGRTINDKKICFSAWPVKQTDVLEIYGIIQDYAGELFEKQLNRIMMEHVNTCVAYHEFKPHPEMLMCSDYIYELLGTKDNFWLIHPDDCVAIMNILEKTRNNIDTNAHYRIKHKNNYWVNVETRFVPWDEGIVTVTRSYSSKNSMP